MGRLIKITGDTGRPLGKHGHAFWLPEVEGEVEAEAEGEGEGQRQGETEMDKKTGREAGREGEREAGRAWEWERETWRMQDQ